MGGQKGVLTKQQARDSLDESIRSTGKSIATSAQEPSSTSLSRWKCEILQSRMAGTKCDRGAQHIAVFFWWTSAHELPPTFHPQWKCEAFPSTMARAQCDR